MNKLVVTYLAIVALLSAIMAGTMGVLAAGVYMPPAWHNIGYNAIAGSPRYVAVEPELRIGDEQGWEEGSLGLKFELISRHDPSIRAAQRNMDKLRAEIPQCLAQRKPEEFTGNEGRRRLVADILRCANEALLAADEPARLEAVYFNELKVQAGDQLVAAR